MCNICNRLFISKPAFEVHVAEEHTEDDTKPSEEATKSGAIDVSFSDDEEDTSKTKKDGEIQNFDDLFGVLEEAPVSTVVNNFIFNKDSDDESDSEMTSASAAAGAASGQKKEAEKPNKPVFSDETLTNGGDGKDMDKVVEGDSNSGD